jgi:long-subunit acyl-CoA synthetase (AMP-forming)
MAGQLVITGRAKDTIVLAGGENVSPQPIEDAVCSSRLIKQCMVVGQDKRTLGAVVCLDEETMCAHLQVRDWPLDGRMMMRMRMMMITPISRRGLRHLHTSGGNF